MRNPTSAFTGIVRRGRTLSVMPTYQCTAACENCGTLSSPSEKTHLSADQVIGAIEEAASLDFVNVVFTGGEPTLRLSIVHQGIELAKRLGLSTRVVTNAHWGRTTDSANLMIRKLCDSGLDEINFSTGDQHVRFVPIEHVVNAILATYRAELPFHLMVETSSTNRIRKDHFVKHPMLQHVVRKLPDSWVFESPWMPLDPGVSSRYDDGVAVDSTNVSACTGCDSILQTIVVQADGRIGACCGLGMRTVPELQVGHVDDPAAISQGIRRAESDIVKIAIRYLGTEKLLAWASSHDPSIDWEGLYAHNCQACMRIYKDPRVREVILKHSEELEADLASAAVFDEVAWPAYMRQTTCRA